MFSNWRLALMTLDAATVDHIRQIVLEYMRNHGREITLSELLRELGL